MPSPGANNSVIESEDSNQEVGMVLGNPGSTIVPDTGFPLHLEHETGLMSGALSRGMILIFCMWGVHASNTVHCYSRHMLIHHCNF